MLGILHLTCTGCSSRLVLSAAAHRKLVNQALVGDGLIT